MLTNDGLPVLSCVGFAKDWFGFEGNRSQECSYLLMHLFQALNLVSTFLLDQIVKRYLPAGSRELSRYKGYAMTEAQQKNDGNTGLYLG